MPSRGREANVIVDPDFCDHWKTRMLVGALDGDEVAPVYVLRLWAHCQNRRRWQFDNLSPEALKALCHFPGPANKLESSLVTSGFVRRDARILVVVGWDEYNSSLIAAWKNGRKGGRPPKKPANIPRETPGEPVGSRLDGIGLDENSHTARARKTLEPAGELNTPEFREAWYRFVDHARAVNPKASDIALEAMLMSLHGKGYTKALKDVVFSLENAGGKILDSDYDFQKRKNGKQKAEPEYESLEGIASGKDIPK